MREAVRDMTWKLSTMNDRTVTIFEMQDSQQIGCKSEILFDDVYDNTH